jgi:hypothetical protein
MAALDQVMLLGFTIPPGETQLIVPEPAPNAGFVHVTALPTAEPPNDPEAIVTPDLPVSPWLQANVPWSVIRTRFGVMVSFNEKLTFPVAVHWTVPAPTTVGLTAATASDATAAPTARPVAIAAIAIRVENVRFTRPPFTVDRTRTNLTGSARIYQRFTLRSPGDQPPGAQGDGATPLA